LITKTRNPNTVIEWANKHKHAPTMTTVLQKKTKTKKYETS